MESFHFLLSTPRKRTKSPEEGLKSPFSPTLQKLKRYTEKYSFFPFLWSRSAVSPIELHEPDKLELDEEGDEEKEFRGWINRWIDDLLEKGSPPWDEHGRNLPEVPVGWFPEKWTPYEVLDFGEYPGKCPW
jgi:hypothetical protein